MNWLASFMGTLFGVNSPDYIGKQGEMLTARTLRRVRFCWRDGKLLQNIYIPKPDGTTTEIDLIYITVKGIFVVESKNYSGYIFGSDKHPKWTATLYAGKDWLGRKRVEKNHFYNPVWQNQAHIKFLKQFLGENIQTMSLIVFSDRCVFMEIDASRPDLAICKRSQVPQVMRGAWNYYPDVIDREKIEAIYKKLYPLTNADEAIKNQHVQSIKSRLNSNDICPRCGGKLVFRTAKTGVNIGKPFYGCSNYPKCRYIKNIE